MSDSDAHFGITGGQVSGGGYRVDFYAGSRSDPSQRAQLIIIGTAPEWTWLKGTLEVSLGSPNSATAELVLEGVETKSESASFTYDWPDGNLYLIIMSAPNTPMRGALDYIKVEVV